MARLRKKDILPLVTRAFLTLLLVAVTFLFARGAIRMFGRYLEASAGSRSAEMTLGDLRERKASLERDTGHLSSERGLEEELRRRYGVAQPGESVIEIMSGEPKAEEEKKSSPMKRLFKWLF